MLNVTNILNILLLVVFTSTITYFVVKFYLKKSQEKQLIVEKLSGITPGRPTYLRFGKSKSFDSEAQINKYNTTPYNMIHPTKCFDCEKQIRKTYNGLPTNVGHSTKCFTCEQRS